MLVVVVKKLFKNSLRLKGLYLYKSKEEGNKKIIKRLKAIYFLSWQFPATYMWVCAVMWQTGIMQITKQLMGVNQNPF